MTQFKSSQTLINKEKFFHINTQISSIFQDYHNLIDTYSYEINFIENSINSFNPRKKFNIKNFIEKQQLLIKDLVNIINNMLFSIKLHSSKNKNSKNKKSIKSIIENNNTNINYNKNTNNNINTNKSFDNNYIYKKNINININNNRNNKMQSNIKNDIKDSLSLLNLKNKKIETKISQYINKPIKKENTNFNNYNNMNVNMNNEISSKNSTMTNIKSFINNSNSYLSDLNINNISKRNTIYKNYNNNQISNISSHNRKINKIRLKLSNYNVKKKEILNSSFRSIKNNNIMNNKSQINEKIKKSESNKSFEKIPISISINSISNMMFKSRSKSTVPLKLTDFSLKKENMPYSTYNETASEDKDIKSGILYIFSDNKITNVKNYDLNGKFQITPHRMTKEVLNNSYNILNKFEKKRKNENVFLKKRSNSILF